MRDRIEVEVSMIPYLMEITLGAAVFQLEFMYNASYDLFTVTLYDSEEQVLVYDEPIIYGVPLFQDVYVAGKFPVLMIEPLDESGQEDAVTAGNFNKTVFLTINEGDDGDDNRE